MRTHIQLFVALAATAAAASAQNQTAPVSGTWVGESPGKRVYFSRQVAFAGGDVRFEGAAVKGAPYSAEAATEVVQTLADGNKIRRENRTLIQRDSEGRTRREETLEAVGPWATGEPHKMIFINDPVAEVQYILNPAEKTGHKIPTPDMESFGVHRYEARRESRSSNVTIRSAPGVALDPPDGTSASFERHIVVERGGHSESSGSASSSSSASAILHESSQVARPEPSEEALGKRMIEGLECVGTRFTTVLEAESIGAERDVEIVFERWTSPELSADVLTERRDPRFGVTTYRLTNINRAEPLASAFSPPADYEIESDKGFMMHRDVHREEEH